MIQAGSSPSFTQEVLPPLGSAQVRLDGLDSHDLVQVDVVGAKNHPHAADPCGDLIEDLQSGERQGRANVRPLCPN